MTEPRKDIRNMSVIAHVDHGKTTLMDGLLRQTGAFRANQIVADRVMDSEDLERERGITIHSKSTAIEYQDVRVNIVDTPGHADFGGEVERILKMVDGVVLLVDAVDGPMPQTKFVTQKALRLGLRPIVVVNKVDRPDARVMEVQNEVFDLFALLDAADEQLDFPTVFASGRDGWASLDPERRPADLAELFDLIVSHVPPPSVDLDAPFSMLATMLDYDPYLGRVLTGRVESGRLRQNDPIRGLRPDGSVVEVARATKMLSFRGLERVPVDRLARAEQLASWLNLHNALLVRVVLDHLFARSPDDIDLGGAFSRGPWTATLARVA